jgi:LPS-assembly protein
LNPKPGFGLEWRADYDPLRHKMIDSGVTADARFGRYFLSVGHTTVAAVPLIQPGAPPLEGDACALSAAGTVQVISPCANQLRGKFGFGDPNKRGWNAAVQSFYDFRLHRIVGATAQVTYNTDCCGFSLQFNRSAWGLRNDNQFRIAFSVANIGSFGSLKRQETLF